MLMNWQRCEQAKLTQWAGLGGVQIETGGYAFRPLVVVCWSRIGAVDDIEETSSRSRK
jgi:hypothetical protein